MRAPFLFRLVPTLNRQHSIADTAAKIIWLVELHAHPDTFNLRAA